MSKNYRRGSGNIHPVDAHIGRRVRAFREQRGVSQERLGHQIDLSFQQLQKYERGDNRVAASTLWKISKALGLTPSDFFEGYDDKTSATKNYTPPEPVPTKWVELYRELTPEGREAIRTVSRHFRKK